MTVDDSEVPFISNNEVVESTFPGGSGALPILLIASSPITKDNKIHVFHDYVSATATPDNGGFGPEGVTNPLLSALYDIFEEGSVTDQSSDELGVDTVYVINIGPSPTAADWTAAQTLSEVLDDKRIVELYQGYSDLSFVNTTANHLLTLDQSCRYRRSVFAPTSETPADAIKETDPTQTSYIRNSRIYMHIDLSKQAKLAAKLAYTHYYDDPARLCWRSVAADDILPLSYSDRNSLIKAGIVCDQPSLQSLNGEKMAQPVKVVSTAYKLGADGKRPADANAHQRANADWTWEQTDTLARAELYNNNTAEGLKFIREEVQDFLNNQETLGYLSDPECEISELTDDPDGISLLKKAKFVGSIYKIEQTSTVKA